MHKVPILFAVVGHVSGNSNAFYSYRLNGMTATENTVVQGILQFLGIFRECYQARSDMDIRTSGIR